MRAILIAALLTFSVGSFASAQDPQPQVIQLALTEITGTPQRPGAFYVMSRTRAADDARELRSSFVHRVVESARRAPLSH